MSLKQYMNEAWQHRYGALIWWIAARYIVIGIEYFAGLHQTMTYWLFGGIPPQFIGGWMTLVGVVGALSRFWCRENWDRKAALATQLFAVGVCVHSFFRLGMFWQTRHLGDPLVVLFSADLIAMFFVLVQIHRAHRRQ